MKKLTVGISGATGAILGIRLLEVLSKSNVETHLIITEAGENTIKMETDWKVEDVKSLANVSYDIKDLGADVSSGSFLAEGMVIIPCSIKSLSGVANSFNENLLIRAADVTLKERRKLVLVVRETPLHLGHIELMLRASRMGAILLPPVSAFYFHPKTIDDLINHTVGKVLDLFGLDHDLFNRWGSSEVKTTLKKKGIRIKIRGRIVEGLRQAANFTQIPWVKNQFISKLSIDPYPGTLNLEITDSESLQNFKKLKSSEGIEITPEDPSFCSAKCYPVLVNGLMKGAIVFPLVDGYPEEKVELIAGENVKKTFSLKTGDDLEIDIS